MSFSSTASPDSTSDPHFISSPSSGNDVIEVLSRSTCTSQYLPIWFFVLLVYKGVLLFYGTYLSWVIRHVTLPSMNDSTCIIISCHVTTIVSAAAVSLAVIFKEWPDVVYTSFSAAVWLSTTVTLSVEFLPKVSYYSASHLTWPHILSSLAFLLRYLCELLLFSRCSTL